MEPLYYQLKMIGVSLKGSAFVNNNNMSVVLSILVLSILKKKILTL